MYTPYLWLNILLAVITFVITAKAMKIFLLSLEKRYMKNPVLANIDYFIIIFSASVATFLGIYWWIMCGIWLLAWVIYRFASGPIKILLDRL